MRFALHQPNYFPYPGYFEKLSAADVFMFLDDCQYEKGGYTNRCLINDGKKDEWLTVPVIVHLGMKVNEVKVKNTDWQEKHYRRVKQVYGVSIYDILNAESNKLIDFNIRSIGYFRNVDGIKMSSEFEIKSTGTERIIELCKAVNCDEYLSGQGGKKYLDEKLFKKSGIKLTYISPSNNKYSALHYV